MRTTVVLEDALVAKAREILGEQTLRGLLEAALREAVRARQRQMLIEAIVTGTSALGITEEDLEVMRRDRPVLTDWTTGAAHPPAVATRSRSAGHRSRTRPTR